MAYRQAMDCSLEEASYAIADWPEYRLQLEVELLSEQLQNAGNLSVSKAVTAPTNASSQLAVAESGA